MAALNFINGIGSVATRYGLDEAVLLHSMVFWWRTARSEGRNFREDRWWTYHSVRGLGKIFPWWSEKQIRRILASCLEQGALVEGVFNDQPRDRTKWYAPGEELLKLYGEAGEPTEEHPPGEEPPEPICPNGQMELPKRANAFAQMGRPLPCSTTVVQSEDPPLYPPQGGAPHGKKRSRESKAEPDWKPERFAGFWKFYPRGENKQGAIRAWDKLKPSDELIDTMAQALKRQVASEDWLAGIGIPHASTWINQKRWTDEIRKGQGAEPAAVVEERGSYFL